MFGRDVDLLHGEAAVSEGVDGVGLRCGRDRLLVGGARSGFLVAHALGRERDRVLRNQKPTPKGSHRSLRRLVVGGLRMVGTVPRLPPVVRSDGGGDKQGHEEQHEPRGLELPEGAMHLAVLQRVFFPENEAFASLRLALCLHLRKPHHQIGGVSFSSKAPSSKRPSYR